MIHTIKRNWLLLLLIALLSAFYLAGIDEVPFHPDESTQLFMSADVELFLADPGSLFWQPGAREDLRQHYRELDAPLARYLAGVGRQLSGQPPLPKDWDWSATWAENRQAGSLPAPGLLRAGRWSIALLFPFSLLFLFLTAQKLDGALTAWLSLFFFTSNALILLHTRRVMAEGVLVFTILATLFATTHLRKSRWLAAIPAALAFLAKQSAAPLLALGLVVCLWPAPSEETHSPSPTRNRLVFNTVAYLIVCAALVALLNPFLWKYPLQAGRAAWDARQELTANQVATIGWNNPEVVLSSPAERALAVVVQLFFPMPAIADVANYQAETRETAALYLNNPLYVHNRGPLWGSAALILSLFGFLNAGLKASRADADTRRTLVILLTATTLQFLSLAVVVALPFQRYVLPLVPFVCIWQAYGLSILLKSMAASSPHTVPE